MLDEQHGDATVTDGRDGIHQGHGLLVVHAARGLVQDQQPGVGGQGAGDLQQALVAVGKTAGGLGVMIGQAHELQLFHAAFHSGLFLAALPGRVQHGGQKAGFQAAVTARQHVLQRGQLAEQTDALEGAGNAHLHDIVRALAGDVLAAEGDAAVFGLVVARDAVEDRGLARPVGADEAHHAALLHREGQLVDGDQATEDLADLMQLQQAHARPPSFSAVRASSARRTALPSAAAQARALMASSSAATP